MVLFVCGFVVFVACTIFVVVTLPADSPDFVLAVIILALGALIFVSILWIGRTIIKEIRLARTTLVRR